ncbi:hypothetical protein IMX26_07270 [Clostridium sp. 'deep sea']|uniref:hypothetical protein n=1 Tax=Clostridium sp. 'deep sea' TaxID=2779445 RepID=UPI00189682D8|nr:hypothetical protein [Clostridium sp. 'deep sea']QOR36600.1 hypothetical protein IMX26_07270 [Clostridium sp. 'deep sea']
MVHIKNWNVVHVINNEKLSKDEIIAKYPIKIKAMAIKMVRVFASNNNIEIKISD